MKNRHRIHSTEKILEAVKSRVAKQRRSRAKSAPTSYPPGWFSEPVHRATRELPFGFPPLFQPQIGAVVSLQSGPAASARASALRDECHAEGKGWAGGSIPGLSAKPSAPRARPEWMGKGGS